MANRCSIRLPAIRQIVMSTLNFWNVDQSHSKSYRFELYKKLKNKITTTKGHVIYILQIAY